MYMLGLNTGSEPDEEQASEYALEVQKETGREKG